MVAVDPSRAEESDSAGAVDGVHNVQHEGAFKRFGEDVARAVENIPAGKKRAVENIPAGKKRGGGVCVSEKARGERRIVVVFVCVVARQRRGT